MVDTTPTASESLTRDNVLMPTLLSPEKELSKPVEVLEEQMDISKDSNKKPLKDEKEPIQIIRGGRVITLPPIEAPATRSKRLQTKTETLKSPEPIKNVEKFT